MDLFNNERIIQKNKSWTSNILEYFNDKVYMLCLLITALGSYGFLITHYSVSTDDLMGEYYYHGGLFAQGRVTGTVIMRLFNLDGNAVWIQDFLGVIIFCFSAILLCVLLDFFVETKNHIPQIIFSCVFVSYPLHSEIFCYDGCTIAVSSCFVLVTYAILCIIRANIVNEKKKKVLYYFLAVVLLTAVESWYESLIIVYCQLVLAVFIIKLLNNKYKFSEYFQNALKFIIPLALAIIFEIIGGKIVLKIIDTQANGYNKLGYWLEGYSFGGAILRILNHMVKRIPGEFFKGLFYFPLGLFAVVFFIFVILSIIAYVKKKNILLLLTSFLLSTTPFILIVVLGRVVHRTFQPYSILVALVFFAVAYYSSRFNKVFLKRILCGIMGFVIVLQVIYINDIFVTDNKRYEEEKKLVSDICYYIESNDIKKDVVFVGDNYFSDTVNDKAYIKTDDIRIKFLKSFIPDGWVEVFLNFTVKVPYGYCMKRLDSNCTSYLQWARDFFGHNPLAFNNIFEYCGYSDVKYGTYEQYEDALKYFDDMTVWPSKASIKETDDYIVIKIGERRGDLA